MRKHIKIPSLNRRRDRADEIETTQAVAHFAGITAELAAHRDEPLGADDVDQADAEPEPWTPVPDPDPVDPDAETQQIPAVPAAAAHAVTEQLPMIHTPQPGIRQRPPAPPATGPGWTEQDARAISPQTVERIAETRAAIAAASDAFHRAEAERIAKARAAIAAADKAFHHAEAEPEQLPVPRRRHMVAVGAWWAERMKPVPLPAIPDADRFTPAIPAMPPAAALPPAPDPTPAPAARALDSGRLALEAAASTEIPDEHPDDFVEWLRAEFADLDRRYNDVLAGHARDAQADLDALHADYFQDADRTLDELNAATLPGWISLENDLFKTGVFA